MRTPPTAALERTERECAAAALERTERECAAAALERTERECVRQLLRELLAHDAVALRSVSSAQRDRMGLSGRVKTG